VAEIKPESEAKPDSDVGSHVVWIGAIGIILFALVLVHLMVVLWPTAAPPPANYIIVVNPAAPAPSPTPATSEPTYENVVLFRWFFGGYMLWLMRDVRLLLLVIVAGGVGTLVHIASSFSTFVGNRALKKSWICWYVLRPVVGMALAVLFYCALRGGFLAVGTDSHNVNLYGVVALSALAGLFSKQAADKLEEVFCTMFKTDNDKDRKDKLLNRRVKIRSFIPGTLSKAASPDTRLTVLGQNFSIQAKITIDGTSFTPDASTAKPDSLTITVPQSVYANKAELLVRVVNPDAEGGASDEMNLPVAP
jgi:hypothetical protein